MNDYLDYSPPCGSFNRALRNSCACGGCGVVRYIRKERMERVGSFKRIAGAWLFDDLRSARWSGYTGICLMFYTLMFPARSGSETGLIVEVRCDVVC